MCSTNFKSSLFTFYPASDLVNYSQSVCGKCESEDTSPKRGLYILACDVWQNAPYFWGGCLYIYHAARLPTYKTWCSCEVTWFCIRQTGAHLRSTLHLTPPNLMIWWYTECKFISVMTLQSHASLACFVVETFKYFPGISEVELR